MTRALTIDGSRGEGGGQVLRTVLALSVITGRPVRVTRIRAGRRKPGLAPQHLTGLLALARICNAEIEGASLRSTEVWFAPRSNANPGEYTFDVAEAAKGGSAGSVTLLLQALLVPLALAGGASRLTLKGGTHVAWSPPFDYFTDVLLPTLETMGLRAIGRLDAPGFYPVGGGSVTVEIESIGVGRPVALAPLVRTERGILRRIRGRAMVGNLPDSIPRRMKRHAEGLLAGLGCAVEIEVHCVESAGTGAALCLVADYDHGLAGFSALGERGKSSERVAEEACADLIAHHGSGAPIGAHLADQILMPAALAAGRSEFVTSRVTSHLLTNADLLERILGTKIRIDGELDQPSRVVVDGGLS